MIRRCLAAQMPGIGGGYSARILVRACMGVFFVLVLHGVGCIFVLAHAWVFYALARLLAGKQMFVPMVWAAALTYIVLTDRNILPEESMHFRTWLGPSAAFLDAEPFSGIYHWSHSLKLMLLRSMSFVLDWHRALISGVWFKLK